jgi:hypothetical protein
MGENSVLYTQIGNPLIISKPNCPTTELIRKNKILKLAKTSEVWILKLLFEK